MFVDYYALLDVSQSANSEEIKQAFKKQAIKWHPDRNLAVDTTVQMQRINEAYLILKDLEARRKFDLEYSVFKEQKREHEIYSESEIKNNYKKYEYKNYKINDDVLNTWISNARKQAISLAQETIKDFRGMAVAGIKEGAKASGNALLGYIVLGIAVSIIVALVKVCN